MPSALFHLEGPRSYLDSRTSVSASLEMQQCAQLAGAASLGQAVESVSSVSGPSVSSSGPPTADVCGRELEGQLIPILRGEPISLELARNHGLFSPRTPVG